MKKFIAAILSLCIVGGSLPAVYSGAPESVITASAEEEYTEVTEGVLTYRIYEDYACMITCDRSASGEIVIPSVINGVPVEHIGDVYVKDYGFKECESITAVIIPDTVISIGSEAFSGCTALKSLTLPSSVMYTSYDSFSLCSSLEEITILNPKCRIDYFATIICNGYDEENHNYYYNGIIRGYDNSTAQYYAEFFGRNFESLGEAPTEAPTDEPTTLKKGDANGDDDVDMSDVVMVMQACLNPKKYGVDGTSEDRITAEGEIAGDVDGNAGLTANDALIIQRYSLKLIDTL